MTVAHWYNTHVNQQWATIWLVGLALFLLLVFVTQLRAVLIRAGGEQRLWPNIVFASMILLVGATIVSGSFTITLFLASHNHDYAVAHFINFYEQNNELLLLAGVVFLTLSAGLAILLNRGANPLPKRLGWYSLLVAVVGMAGPFSFFCLPVRVPHLGPGDGHRDRGQDPARHPRRRRGRRAAVAARQAGSRSQRRTAELQRTPTAGPRCAYSAGAGLLSRPPFAPGAIRLRAAVKIIRTAMPMMARSSSIWAETTRRAVSVLGVMSPKPTVENTLIVK